MQALDSAVVLELGSGHLRAGSPHYFPAENEPFVVTEASGLVHPSNGPLENGMLAAGGGPGTLAAGPSRHADSTEGRQLVHPIVQGEIKDWEVLEALMEHVLYNRMGWAHGEEGPLLLAEPMLTSRDERERLCQLAFEVFNVPAFFAADQAVLSLYCIGRLSGLVVDVGLDKIDIAPVVDGLLLPSSARRLPYGGRQLTQHLVRLLAQRSAARGGSDPVQLDFEGAEQLKQAIFQVAESSSSSSVLTGTQADAATAAALAATALAGSHGSWQPSPTGQSAPDTATVGSTTHTLPDGQTITVGGEGLALGEALLAPLMMGFELPPLATTALAAVTALEEKAARKAVGETILVCGGGSASGFACGLPPRLLREMRACAPVSLSLTLAAVPEYLPSHSLQCAAWMGGAALGRFVFQHGQLTQQSVTKAEYEEWGPLAVHRKCS